LIDSFVYSSLPFFMTIPTFKPTCADDGSVNEYVYMYVYVCMYVYKLPVILYQIHFYKHFTYHRLCLCSVWATAYYLLYIMPLALLTGNSQYKILKSRIYFQHPLNRTKCINYEFHKSWQRNINKTDIVNLPTFFVMTDIYIYTYIYI
jgi:hypothetical protein